MSQQRVPQNRLHNAGFTTQVISTHDDTTEFATTVGVTSQGVTTHGDPTQWITNQDVTTYDV